MSTLSSQLGGDAGLSLRSQTGVHDALAALAKIDFNQGTLASLCITFEL